MKNYKELLNNAAKWGLILGVLMAASRIVETTILVSGDLSEYLFLTFEWVASIVIYISILFMANRQAVQAAEAKAEASEALRYTFRDTLNYSILISIFASFIVAVSSHIYIVNSIGGYVNFAEATTASLNAVIAESGVDMEGNAALLEQSAAATADIANNPPTILSAVLSSVANYIVAGFFSTLVIFWFVRRRGAKSDSDNE